MNSKIRILVADDHLVARVGVTTIVNTQRDMTVVAEALNGRQAVEMYRKFLPDVSLLDMRMPIMSGLEAAVAIRGEFPDAKIIALTTYGGDEDVRRALKAGVQVYLTKDAPHHELLKAIYAAYKGESYVLESLADVVAAGKSKPSLTPRELQVLALVVRGLVNKQIADELQMSENTVKGHVKAILAKLGAQDRTQAATDAIRRGIIHLS
jgi:two-component system, NarL family, response regulator